MTAAQIIVLSGLLVVCCFLLIWMTIEANRSNQEQNPSVKSDDRDRILEMLCQVEDQSSLSAYKKAYNIEDTEIVEKKKELETVHRVLSN